MRILYIDPWCYDGSNLYYYSTGLVDGLVSAGANVTLVSGMNFTSPSDIKCEVIRSFFPHSQTMKHGIFRKIIRGCEYINTYIKIVKLLQSEKFDVVHIEWPLFYSVDKIFYKLIKKKTKVLSLKAHNILPHSSFDKYVEVFREIYQIPDVVLVHGNSLKEEFKKYYPELVDKVVIQNHGIYMNHQCLYEISQISAEIQNIINRYKRVYLFFGRIDYDKGVDRLINIWQDFDNEKSLLVIAGRISDGYDFSMYEKKTNNSSNTLFINGFVEDNLLNYLISNSNIVVLPYRDGSMSGIVFTVAEFEKPIITTKFGAIVEYLEDRNDCFIVDNNDDSLKKMLVMINDSISNETLNEMGANLKNNIARKYQWDAIGKKLVNETFAPMVRK